MTRKPIDVVKTSKTVPAIAKFSIEVAISNEIMQGVEVAVTVYPQHIYSRVEENLSTIMSSSY